MEFHDNEDVLFFLTLIVEDWNNQQDKVAFALTKGGKIVDSDQFKTISPIFSSKSDIFSVSFDPFHSLVLLSGARDGGVRQTDLREKNSYKINKSKGSILKVLPFQTDDHLYAYSSNFGSFYLADRRKNNAALACIEFSASIDATLDFHTDLSEDHLFLSNSKNQILIYDLHEPILLNTLSLPFRLSAFLPTHCTPLPQFLVPDDSLEFHCYAFHM